MEGDNQTTVASGKAALHDVPVSVTAIAYLPWIP